MAPAAVFFFTNGLTHREHCLKMMARHDRSSSSLLPADNTGFCLAHTKRRGGAASFLEFYNLTRLIKHGTVSWMEKPRVTCVNTHVFKECRLSGATAGDLGSEGQRGRIALALQFYLWSSLPCPKQGQPRADPWCPLGYSGFASSWSAPLFLLLHVLEVLSWAFSSTHLPLSSLSSVCPRAVLAQCVLSSYAYAYLSHTSLWVPGS